LVFARRMRGYSAASRQWVCFNLLMAVVFLPVLILFPPLPFVGATLDTASWARGGGLIWLSGCVVFSLRAWFTAWQYRRRERRSQFVDEGPLFIALETCRCQLGVREPVRLLIGPGGTRAMTWGIRHPVILLPVEALSWSPDGLWSVLLHELGHIKRKDSLTRQLGQWVCLLHWFNPLAWMAYRKMCCYQEEASDNLAMGWGIRPSDYASHLVAVAGVPRVPSGSGRKLKGPDLGRRVEAILERRMDRSSLQVSSALAYCCLFGFALLGVSQLTGKREVDEPGRLDGVPFASNGLQPRGTWAGIDGFPPDEREKPPAPLLAGLR
ncbi:MAG: M56 family metallopeptidase, partial [Verrucomicrobiota bacterium]